MNPNEIIAQLAQLAVQYGPKIIGAILVLLIGLRLIKALNKGMDKMMDKSKIDATLKPFIKSIIDTLLKIVLVISVLGMVGVEMTSFIAISGVIEKLALVVAPICSSTLSPPSS